MIGTPIMACDLYDENLSEQENLQNIANILREKVLELKDELNKRTSKEK